MSGGSSGIGKAIALELAQEGCDVAVHGRDKAKRKRQSVSESLGVKTFPVFGDLATDSVGCDAAADGGRNAAVEPRATMSDR